MIKWVRELPTYVKAVIGVIVLGLSLIVIVAVELNAIRDREDRRQCVSDVSLRNDNRAMWVWLGDRYISENEEDVLELLAALNLLLPRLECVGNSAIPVEE